MAADSKTDPTAGAITSAPGADNASIEKADLVKLDGADEAGAFVGAQAMIIDEETNTRILRRIDWHMLPIMSGLYMLQYLDKVLLSYTAVMNIKTDINLSADQYSWAGSIFYFGYLVFEYPHNFAMQRLPIGKYMASCVMAWGVVLCCTAAIKNPTGLLVTRFFLGAGEGAITAVAQIVGGLIAYGVSQGLLDHPLAIASWKFLFILVGGVTGLYGIFMWFFLADSPIRAKWLSEEEKHIAVERIRVNQQGIGSRVFKWHQVKEAFTDIRTYILFLFAITLEIPNGGVTVFFTLMIQAYGFTSQQSFLLSTPAGVFQIFTGIGIPYLAGKYKQRMLGAVAGQLLSLFGISLMAGLAMNDPLNARIGQLFGYYIMIGSGAVSLIMILSVVATNTAGHTKKTVVNSVVLIGYCIGFLIGPQTFRDAPYYYNAKYNIIVMWTMTLFCCVALWIVNMRENKRRDRKWEADGRPPQPPGQEFLDLTDKENPYFRYAL
ncbi:MFS general substrate transporter [Thozetella sp. PMI_491]|nr:MFS general substrate transporter [Thozetella sp. PMI_491]